MVEKSIVNIIKKYASTLENNGLLISAVYLFGSQVRGNADLKSDIDLLVISPAFDHDRLTYAGRLWKLAAKVDPRIEPIPVGERTFQTDKITPIYEIVRQEGVRII